MNIVFSSTKSTVLSTLMNESNFARSVNGLNFTEKGVHISFTLFKNDFNFSDWSFDGTNADDENDVKFEGKGFGAKTGLEILTGSDRQKAVRFTYALITAVAKAIETKHVLPQVGAGGILYKENTSKSKPGVIKAELLFLPENIFELAASNLSEKDYSENQGFFQNKALTGNNSAIFLQSVAAYYTFAKIFPFMKTSVEERQEDIIDSNFIQIENFVEKINPELALSINMGLNIDSHYEREKSLINPELLKTELALNDDGTSSFNDRNSSSTDEKALKQKIILEQKSLEQKTKAKRIFKRYSFSILAVLICMAIITNVCYKTYKDSLEKPSAKNLDSKEAIETFYTGFHQLKTDLMMLVSKCQESKNLTSMIGNIYVTSTTRQAYEGKYSSLTPELYLNRPELMDYWIFGITNFKIDGNAASNYFYPQSKAHIIALEKNGQLKKFDEGKEESHEVSFTQLSSSGMNSTITITEVTQLITCTYIKDQWYITEIESSQSESLIEVKDFLEDYKTEFLENEKDVLKTVSALREKYEWLPDETAMINGLAVAEYQKNYFK
ncbi:MAG: hypothetical protein J6X37_00120 [Treponema sp.]|nr:hypothetical protein [Treponema sp.]